MVLKREANHKLAFLEVIILHVLDTVLILFFWFFQVGQLLGRHPDLVEGFDDFFTRCETLDGLIAVAGGMNK
ncbi:hypothetical protein U1Q18_032877, partial [Sarracenia purpurea var. burkii]